MFAMCSNPSQVYCRRLRSAFDKVMLSSFRSRRVPFNSPFPQIRSMNPRPPHLPPTPPKLNNSIPASPHNPRISGTDTCTPAHPSAMSYFIGKGFVEKTDCSKNVRRHSAYTIFKAGVTSRDDARSTTLTSARRAIASMTHPRTDDERDHDQTRVFYELAAVSDFDAFSYLRPRLASTVCPSEKPTAGALLFKPPRRRRRGGGLPRRGDGVAFAASKHGDRLRASGLRFTSALGNMQEGRRRLGEARHEEGGGVRSRYRVSGGVRSRYRVSGGVGSRANRCC